MAHNAAPMHEDDAMDRASGASGQPPLARRLLRVAGGLVLFVVFGFLGRVTVIDEGSLSLIWPAAGVAALWLASGSRQTWPGDFAALAVASVAVNVTTGAPLGAAIAFAVSNVLQIGLFTALARRWIDDVWGLGGSTPLHRVADLGRLVAVAVTASLAGAATGALGLWLTGAHFDLVSVLVWWGRNAVSLIVITVFGLLAGAPLFAARSPRELGRILLQSVHARTLARLVEAELLVAISVGLYAVIFGQRTAEPLAFLVLAVSVWAGLRFTPIAVMAHGLATGAAGLLFTLHGYGPFASIESPHYRALVAQVFIVTTVLTGLSLAFSRGERDDANRRLAVARRESDDRARLLEAILESMKEGLVVVEDGGRILVANSATQELLGLDEPHDRLRPAASYGLFHEDGTAVTDGPGRRALEGEEIPPADFHLRVDTVPQGRVLEIGARPLAQQGPDDRALAMINIRDVTLDRQHRDTLASFAGVVAHDLFNPLTLVTGWAESLEEEFADGAVPAAVGLPMVERLRDAANHMRHVIGDLLAYTVARDQSLRPGPVDLTAEIRALAQLRADGPGAPEFSVAPGMDVWGDPGLVRQLFDNLLGNAVKYVAPGVRPRVDVRGHRDRDWLEVRVTDNGIGIPEDHRELVFENFHRVDRDGYQGTGLGLAICRRIADRHGGSIHAEQGPDGLGTTFVVTLPANAAGYTAGTSAARPAVAHTAVRPVEEQRSA